jgi:hypothetical protein
MELTIDLEKHLKSKGQLNNFLDVYNSIREKGCEKRSYANSILGAIEIAHSLNESGIPYCFSGGLSVLFHLHQVDNNSFLSWRGTDNIDLLIQEEDKETIVNKTCFLGYEYAALNRVDTNKAYSKSKYLKEEHGEISKLFLHNRIQDYNCKSLTKKVFEEYIPVNIFGVKVNVPMLKHIIQAKSDTQRRKDREDISLLKKAYK